MNQTISFVERDVALWQQVKSLAAVATELLTSTWAIALVGMVSFVSMLCYRAGVDCGLTVLVSTFLAFGLMFWSLERDGKEVEL